MNPAPGSLGSPRVTPASDWLSAFLPLGIQRDEAWSPCGAGVLFLDPPLVWLFTARSVYEAARDATLAAFVRAEGRVVLVDLTTGRGSGERLEWLLHPELDLAAAIFPLQPAWKVKAFPEARAFRARDVEPLQPAATIGAPYGLEPGPIDPRPIAVAGSIARADPGRQELLATAPLLPRNVGAPLVMSLPPHAGGGVALVGVATHTLAVPEPHQSSAPPVRLTAAVSVGAAIDLIRSERGKAQRQAALGGAKDG